MPRMRLDPTHSASSRSARQGPRSTTRRSTPPGTSGATGIVAIRRLQAPRLPGPARFELGPGHRPVLGIRPQPAAAAAAKLDRKRPGEHHARDHHRRRSDPRLLAHHGRHVRRPPRRQLRCRRQLANPELDDRCRRSRAYDSGLPDLFLPAADGDGPIDVTVDSSILAEEIQSVASGVTTRAGLGRAVSNTDVQFVLLDSTFTDDCVVGANGNTDHRSGRPLRGRQPVRLAARRGLERDRYRHLRGRSRTASRSGISRGRRGSLPASPDPARARPATRAPTSASRSPARPSRRR